MLINDHSLNPSLPPSPPYIPFLHSFRGQPFPLSLSPSLLPPLLSPSPSPSLVPPPSSPFPCPSPPLPPLHILTFSSGTFSLSGEIMAMMSLVTMGGAPGSEEGVVPNSSLPGRGEGRISRSIIEGSRHTTSLTQDHCEHSVESLDNSYVSAEPMIQNQ